jgi:chromosome segregation ATPase
MDLHLGYGEKVWKSNEQPIRGSFGTLDIIGKTKDDYDAKNCTVRIHFSDDDSLYSRKQYLEMLRAEVEALLNANAKAIVEAEEQQQRQDGYRKELAALKEAQRKELERLDAVKELAQRHEQETEAVSEQLKKSMVSTRQQNNRGRNPEEAP